MTSKKEKPEDVNEYIISFPKETQKKLREILESLRKAAPGAEENLKWGVPALSYDWILFTFAAYKNHISLYPHPRTIKLLRKTSLITIPQVARSDSHSINHCLLHLFERLRIFVSKKQKKA